jgi:hypothetical protein
MIVFVPAGCRRTSKSSQLSRPNKPIDLTPVAPARSHQSS